MKIGILYGGVSSERTVSLNSGKNVAEILQGLGHEVILIDVVTELLWRVFDQEIIFSDIVTYNFDLIFNALHGEFGEDGKLQSLLEILKIPYTGSGVLASSLGMNKSKCYEMLEKWDIDMPKTYEISNAKELEYLELPYPLFVKPNNGGSSIATGRANNREELDTLVNTALEYSNLVLVQELIEGEEVTCPILGSGGHAYALPVGLIKTNNTFFDYEAKYNSDTTEEIFPAPISQKTTESIKNIALEVHRILDCKGISRSDFIITPTRIVFLEINTSPGMTLSSLCPKSAKANSMSMEKLLNAIINDV